MIQRWSYYLTQKIFDSQCEIEEFEIHQYGIEVIISTFINVSLLLLIGVITHTVPDAIMYFFLFMILRKFCGGYHCRTYFSCILTHISIYMFYVIIKRLIDFENLYLVFLSLLSMIILAPVHLRKLDESEYKKYKIISILITILYIIIYYVTQEMIVLYVLYIIVILLFLCIIRHGTIL